MEIKFDNKLKKKKKKKTPTLSLNHDLIQAKKKMIIIELGVTLKQIKI